MKVEAMAQRLPGAELEVGKMPGHWVLSRLGKRVLRPGGLELTRALLDRLAIASADDVVEFAPGLGVTAKRTLSRRPASYTAVERDKDAAARVRSYLSGPAQRVLVGTAQETGLADGAASVVYGEALLTMQTAAGKQAIVAEAARLLRPGGRYGLHEIAISEDATPEERAALEAGLRDSIRVGARPLTPTEWEALLTAEGLEVTTHLTSPMALLEPRRIIADEGWRGALRFVLNLLRQPEARRRVLAMRQVFRQHAHRMSAILLIARKVEVGAEATRCP